MKSCHRLTVGACLAGALLFGGATINVVAAGAGPAGIAETTEAVVSDLTELRTLTFASGEPRWLLRLEDAVIRLLQRAGEETDPAKAQLALDQALKLTGVAWAGLATQNLSLEPAPTTAADPFEARLAVARAFAEAYGRLGVDRTLAATLQPRIDHLLALREIGQVSQASAELRDLYESLRLSLATELNGQTVVRALEFVTPEDEYLYELDRHDAHLLIMRQFVVGATEDPEILSAVAEASRHHVDAHQQALAGHYAQAIWVLEHSSEELVRVLRSKGLDIPG